MRGRIITGAALALLLGSTLTAADLKSGPQPGQSVSAFNPLHCTGARTGSRDCLV
jgi:hypothetical protein